MIILLAVGAVRAKHRGIEASAHLDAYMAAAKRKQWIRADISLARWLDHNHSAEGFYQLSRLRYEQGRMVEADEWLRFLAPDDRKGLARAHMHRAQELLVSAKGASKADVLERAEQHLRRAMAPRFEATVHALLGAVLLEQGNDEAGFAELRLALKCERPAVGVILQAYATWLARTPEHDPRREKIRVEAVSLAKAFLLPAARKLALYEDRRLRRWLVLALRLVGRLDSAMNVLRDGIERHPRERVWRRVASAVCIQQAGILGPSTPPGRKKLREAVDLCRDDGMAMAVILRMPEVGPDVQAYIESYLGEPGEESINFFLGSVLLVIDRPDAARPFLERAFVHFPTQESVVNNLALCLARQGKAEPKRALALVEQALDKNPDDVTLRNTRGEVLCRLGRHREALALLQSTLPEQSSFALATTYAAMSRSYAALGQRSLARRCRQRSAKAKAAAFAEAEQLVWGLGLN